MSQSNTFQIYLTLVASSIYSKCLPFITEAAARTPGQIEDLSDLLAKDWTALGSV